MITPGAICPGPACPARHGDGADLSTAEFTLVTDDCENGPDWSPTTTDLWGYFGSPSEECDDVVLTGGVEVPATSPIAQLAHQVAANSDRVEHVAAHLRRNVARCPCIPLAKCPALDELSFLTAIELEAIEFEAVEKAGG